MFKTKVAVLSMALVLASAVYARGDKISYKHLLARNAENISQLAEGMSKEKVVELMKSYTVNVHGTLLTNPFKTDVSQRGSDTYEVLYYLVRRYPPFTPVRESQATPVVLKNGVVIGWGNVALQSVKE
jgi:hypothetical protein